MTKSVSVKKMEAVPTAATLSPRSITRPYYGWVMLPIAMAALIATSPGQTFGVSIFNEPMRDSLALSHGQLAAAYMLGTLMAAVPLAYVGTLMDRFGLRRTIMAAIFVFGLACLVTSQARGWWSVFIAFWLLRLLGPGALAFLSSNTMAFWFHRRLGTIEGIRQVGMGLAIAVVPTLNLWLVLQFGWRGAYAFLGLAIWCLMLPLVYYFFRNRPEDVGQRIDGEPPDRPDEVDFQDNRNGGSTLPASEEAFTLRESLGTRSFWIVAGGTSLFGLIHTAVFFSLVPIFFERGFGELDAAQMVTAFAISLAAMQLIGGTLADRYQARFLLPVAFAVLTGGVLLLLTSESALTAKLSGALMGISQGLFFGTSNPLWARYFGRLHLGKIRGTLATMNIASSSLGPLLFGLARDALGDYNLILAIFAVLPVPLLFLSLLVTPPRKAIDSVLS